MRSYIHRFQHRYIALLCCALIPAGLLYAGNGEPIGVHPTIANPCTPYTLSFDVSNSEAFPVDITGGSMTIYQYLNSTWSLVTALTTPGGTLPPSGQLTLSTPGTYQFPGSGRFKITASFNATNDIDPSNNSQDFFVNVVNGPPCLLTNSNYPFAGQTADPVNGFSQGFHYSPRPDLFMPGPMDMFFTRNYDAYYVHDGLPERSLGPNWSHNFDYSLHPYDGNFVEVITANGMYIAFENTGGAFSCLIPQDTPYQLLKNGSAWLFYDPITVRVYDFNADGRLTRIDDTRGNAQSLSYANNLLDQVADGTGRTLDFEYDSNGNLTRVFKAPYDVEFSYTGGVLTTCTDARGNMTTYTYDPSMTSGPIITGITHPEGNTPYTMTVAGPKVLSQTNALSGTTTLSGPATPGGALDIGNPGGSSYKEEHDNMGRLTRFTDEEQNEVLFEYDGLGRRTKITDRNGEVSIIDFDPLSGYPSSISDFDGNIWMFAYTPRTYNGFTIHERTQVTHPGATTEVFMYNASGHLGSYTDQLGETWTYTNNAFGQPLTQTSPLGAVWTHGYDAAGVRTSTQTPDGATYTLVCDALYRTNKVSKGSAVVAEWTYDGAGNVVSAKDARGNTSGFSYDDNGRMVAFTDWEQQTTTYEYDFMDRLEKNLDPNGNWTLFPRNENGRVSSVTDRESQATQLIYDSRGNITGVLAPGGASYGQGFDDEWRLMSTTDPLSGTTQFTRDANSNITGITSPNSASASFTYDPLNRLTGLSSPSGGQAQFQYDASGNLTGIQLPEGVQFGLTYNEIGGVTSASDGNGNQRTYEYDAAGNRVKRTDPLNNETTYSYDDQGRRTQTTFPGAMGSATFSYDPNGNRTGETYSDGVTRTYQYDRNDNLISVDGDPIQRGATGAVFSYDGITYTRDKEDRITGVSYGTNKEVSFTRNAAGVVVEIDDWLPGSVTFDYDAMNRPTEIVFPNNLTTQFQYDPSGNRISIDFGSHGSISTTYNPDGTVASTTRNVPLPANVPDIDLAFTYNSASYINGRSYDQLGRVTGDGTLTRTWNLAGNMTSVTDGSSGMDIDWNALNLPARFEVGSDVFDITWGLGGGAPVPLIISENGSPQTYNIFLDNGTLLYSINASNARSVYHFDEQGNTLFTTNDNGAVDNAFAYDPYGNVLDSQNGDDVWFGYRGQFGAFSAPVIGDWNGDVFAGSDIYGPGTGRLLTPADEKDFFAPFGNRYVTNNANPIQPGPPANCADKPGSAGFDALTRLRNRGFQRFLDNNSGGSFAHNHWATRGWQLFKDHGQTGGANLGGSRNSGGSPLISNDFSRALAAGSSSNILRGDYYSSSYSYSLEAFPGEMPVPGFTSNPQPPGSDDNLLWGDYFYTSNTQQGGKPLSPGVRSCGVFPNRTTGLPAIGGSPFWYFDDDNLEAVAKVLDANTINNRFWFFSGGLTNLEYQIRVTDTGQGTTRTYVNPPGRPFQPIQDTNAFATCP
jgi:YD repeat-containing protein